MMTSVFVSPLPYFWSLSFPPAASSLVLTGFCRGYATFARFPHVHEPLSVHVLFPVSNFSMTALFFFFFFWVTGLTCRATLVVCKLNCQERSLPRHSLLFTTKAPVIHYLPPPPGVEGQSNWFLLLPVLRKSDVTSSQRNADGAEKGDKAASG